MNEVDISKNKKIIIITLVVTLVIVIIVSLVITRSSPGGPASTTSTPTITLFPTEGVSRAPTNSPLTGEPETGVDINPTLEQKDISVGNLYNKMPYTGKNFSMKYNIEEGKYTTTISAANKAEGEQEFDQFLHSLGIQQRDWIYGLVIEYK